MKEISDRLIQGKLNQLNTTNMKKNLVLIGLLTSTISFAQDNTLPTQGNVGIGTLTPSSRLDVNGTMKVDSCLIVKDTLITLGDARIGETLKVEGDLVAPNLGPVMNYDASKLLFVDEQGFILKGNSNDATDYLSGIIYSKQCPTDPFADVPNPVWVNGLNKIFIDCPPVQVGIGTNTPRTRLDVAGGIYGGVVMIGQAPADAEGRLHINTQLPSTTASNVIIVENNDRRIMQLDNSGLLRTREVIIDTQVWPDYVFEDAYILMPLAEVEQFIEANGHLPNVPSAAEVEANGQSLGEINQILLEKIEELTLYMIAQQKQIDELKAVIQTK